MLSLHPLILLILMVLPAGDTLAQMAVSYKGEIELPVELYTGDGILLRKGKFDLEVRSEKGHHFLFFLNGGKIVAVVNGQPRKKGVEDAGETQPTIPILGTVYLSPAEPLEKREKGDEAKLATDRYLGVRPWKATVRVYKYANTNNKEVYFIFQEGADSGEWSRTEFKLFLKNP